MDDPLTPYGLKVSVVIAGFAGGVLRALSHKNYTFREAIASPVCGALAAGYLTEPFVHYLRAVHFPLPPDDGSNVYSTCLESNFDNCNAGDSGGAFFAQTPLIFFSPCAI